MAVTDPLATLDDYAAEFPNRDRADEVELLHTLTAVSRYVESQRVCGQQFTKDAAAVVRIFKPEVATSELWLGTNLAANPTQIRLDTANAGTYATTLSSTNWELWPLNAADGPEPRPYRRIDLLPWGTYTSFAANQRVEITAVWGWPTVPEIVRLAVIHLTAIVRLESPRSTTRVDELGSVIGMSAQARDIISNLLAAHPRQPAIA